MPDSVTIVTHFTNIRQIIRHALQHAHDEVLVAVAWFTDDVLFEELMIAAQYRGVNVEIALMDDEINRNAGLDYAAMEIVDIAVWCYPEQLGLMHHKFCVIDRKLLLMGSYNWTRKAAKNEENLVEVAINEQTANEYRAEFERVKASCVRLYARGSPALNSRFNTRIPIPESGSPDAPEGLEVTYERLNQYTRWRTSRCGPGSALPSWLISEDTFIAKVLSVPKFTRGLRQSYTKISAKFKTICPNPATGRSETFNADLYLIFQRITTEVEFKDIIFQFDLDGVVTLKAIKFGEVYFVDLC